MGKREGPRKRPTVVKYDRRRLGKGKRLNAHGNLPGTPHRPHACWKARAPPDTLACWKTNAQARGPSDTQFRQKRYVGLTRPWTTSVQCPPRFPNFGRTPSLSPENRRTNRNYQHQNSTTEFTTRIPTRNRKLPSEHHISGAGP